jgi:AcrR family transcriptional regulator
MRYSQEHKARNHEKILSMAARSIREHGGDTSGIGTVMKKAGLTKGGFYRHFRSKDDLFVEAVARAFDEMGRGMLEVANAAPEGQALRAIIERYLSTRHASSCSSCSPRSVLASIWTGMTANRGVRSRRCPSSRPTQRCGGASTLSPTTLIARRPATGRPLSPPPAAVNRWNSKRRLSSCHNK